MSKPTNLEEFKEYCLRKIGYPVIEVNVSDEQVDDRVTEAILYWQDYHFDGMQHVYLKHQVTQEDIDNKYIVIPDNIVGVVRIFDFSDSIASGTGMFNVQYQFVMNNIHDITSYNVQHYFMAMSHLEMIQDILVGKPIIRYNRHMNRVYIDRDLNQIGVDNYVIVEAYASIDGDEYPDMWSDRWLQNYATALIREQWGRNITKFDGVQLMGGVSFNGQQILSEAKEERMKLEEEVTLKAPLVHNFVG